MKATLELTHDGVTHVFQGEFAGVDIESDFQDIHIWQTFYPVARIVTGVSTTLKFTGKLEEIATYES